MANDIVIRAESLGKKYLIGHQRERYVALRDVMARGARGLWRKTVEVARGRTIVAGDMVEEFWALKDVNFEVRRGEVVGIIGRNGAGKSTLLKILSRITEPSEGRVAVDGRVASLLEVGTGFHPELTGRENIYLNGAILGMTRAEIRRKFDEIVAFADIEKFLDTPVKRYSSGMYVRLAFAVAAHLEPEVLVVDEVLAVGDAEFQKKCLGKMSEVAGGGRTVLFVSHDMHKVTTLCSRGFMLDEGKVACAGDMSSVVRFYLTCHTTASSYADLQRRGDRSGSGEAQLQCLELMKEGSPSSTFIFDEEFTQRITINVRHRIGEIVVASAIRSSDGVPIYELVDIYDGCHWVADPGLYTVSVKIPRLRLYPGSYSIDLWLGDRTFNRVDYLTQVLTFEVVQTSSSGLPRALQSSDGLVRQPASWTVENAALFGDSLISVQ